MSKKIDRNYLEITSLDNLKESSNPNKKYFVELIDPVDFQLNRFFYKNVGKKHNWVDRLSWSDKQWIDYVSDKKVETYVLKFEKDKADGYVPVNKQSHLRPLATINQINKCVSILKGKPKIKRSMWSRRAQEYEAKISSGKIYDLAEVVRDLNKGDDVMIDQSYSERQLFEKAYERLLTEFQIVIGGSYEDAQKKIDKALKRNLAAQTPKVETTKPQEIEPVQENLE